MVRFYKMQRISIERKEAILVKLLPPNNASVTDTAKKEGMSESTLYNWLNQLKVKGQVVPGSKKNSAQWSSEMKFMTVVATAQMNTEEKSKYCRENGLYIDQIEEWKSDCIAGTISSQEQKKQARLEAKQDKKRIKSLEKELHRKEKALAETAALLVLRKKLDAFWEEGNEDD